MAEGIKGKAEEAGNKIAEKAKEVGHKVSEEAGKAVEFVKEKAGLGGKDVGVAGIKEHMDVIASCGKKVGVVDHVEGQAIKLTKKDSPDGQHHFIPIGWAERVDSQVHLKKNSVETEQNWKTEAASCGCG